jgi:hypothetical protein
MPMHIYNAVMLAAWLLVSIGAGLVYLPAGLIVGGLGLVAVLLLTLALMTRRLLVDVAKAAADAAAKDGA